MSVGVVPPPADASTVVIDALFGTATLGTATADAEARVGTIHMVGLGLPDAL